MTGICIPSAIFDMVRHAKSRGASVNQHPEDGVVLNTAEDKEMH